MITSTHSIIYASDPERARAFFRDVLELPYVDVHDGWLIFRLPPGELGIHPESGPDAPSGRHELYLMCDDLDATMARLEAAGATFDPTHVERWGRTTVMTIPGGTRVPLYQPAHPRPSRPAADAG